MSEHDAGTAVRGSIGDDFTQREWRAGLVTDMAGQVKAAGLVVDMGDPQLLAARIGVGEATCKEVAC